MKHTISFICVPHQANILHRYFLRSLRIVYVYNTNSHRLYPLKLLPVHREKILVGHQYCDFARCLQMFWSTFCLHFASSLSATRSLVEQLIILDYFAYTWVAHWLYLICNLLLSTRTVQINSNNNHCSIRIARTICALPRNLGWHFYVTFGKRM